MMTVNTIHTPITPLALAVAKRQALRRRERELRMSGSPPAATRQQVAHVTRAAHFRIERFGSRR